MSTHERGHKHYTIRHVPLWIDSEMEGYSEETAAYGCLESFRNSLQKYFKSVGEKPWKSVNTGSGQKHPSKLSPAEVMRLLDEAKVEEVSERWYEVETQDEEETVAEDMLEHNEITREITTVSDEAHHHLHRAQNQLANYLGGGKNNPREGSGIRNSLGEL